MPDLGFSPWNVRLWTSSSRYAKARVTKPIPHRHKDSNRHCKFSSPSFHDILCHSFKKLPMKPNGKRKIKERMIKFHPIRQSSGMNRPNLNHLRSRHACYFKPFSKLHLLTLIRFRFETYPESPIALIKSVHEHIETHANKLQYGSWTPAIMVGVTPHFLQTKLKPLFLYLVLGELKTLVSIEFVC
jgi:hypothetical protein